MSNAPEVHAFFDDATNTVSYVVVDPGTGRAAAIDSVLDYDPAAGRTGRASADRLIAFVRERGLRVEWLLETHVHADHLTAAPYLQAQLGGRTAIGARIQEVQETFGRLFNFEPEFQRDGRQFDHLFVDNETFLVGQIAARALHTPGHTPACMTYVIGDAAFVGDTLFMPDYGTARCDFPGGDAATLFHSIRRIYALPADTRLFMCHDYGAPGRSDFRWETTVAAERAGNVHLNDRTSEEDFVRLRKARDAALAMPRLILPSVQVNMRTGHMPPPEANGVSYLKIPIDAL